MNRWAFLWKSTTFSVKSSGFVSYSEFIAALLDFKSYRVEQQLRVVFSIFDTEHSGLISKENLKNVLLNHEKQNEGERVDILPDGKTIEDVMREINKDDCQSINFEKFRLK
jgi:Ca2+-binding EF-hand superfamily protein